jgi:hypothetical protein
MREDTWILTLLAKAEENSPPGTRGEEEREREREREEKKERERDAERERA